VFAGIFEEVFLRQRANMARLSVPGSTGNRGENRRLVAAVGELADLTQPQPVAQTAAPFSELHDTHRRWRAARCAR